MENARQQWERVRRYYARFKAINDGTEHAAASSDYYIDDIYAFFQNCYHLKDWIKNDKTAPQAKKDDVEDHINAHPCLRLCADICNGLKHLVLTKPLRSGAEPAMKGRQFGLWLGGEVHNVSVKQTIEHGGTEKDAFTLAGECMKAWELYMA